jgi:hypothetical protein
LLQVMALDLPASKLSPHTVHVFPARPLARFAFATQAPTLLSQRSQQKIRRA